LAIKFEKKAPKQAKATVTTELKEGKETKAESVVHETPDAPVATVPTVEQLPVVGCSMGYTHNLGNYQSARIDVSISIPCPFGEINQIYEWAENWVNERVKKAIDELSGE
jgi:hypothetical protein